MQSKENLLNENQQKFFNKIKEIVSEEIMKTETEKMIEENSIIINVDSKDNNDLDKKIHKHSNFKELINIILTKILLFYLSDDNYPNCNLNCIHSIFPLRRNNGKGEKKEISCIRLKFYIPDDECENNSTGQYFYNFNIELGETENNKYLNNYENFIMYLNNNIENLLNYIKGNNYKCDLNDISGKLEKLKNSNIISNLKYIIKELRHKLLKINNKNK